MTRGIGSNHLSPPWGLRWRSHTLFIVLTVGMGTFVDFFLYALLVPVLPFMLRDRIGVPDHQIQRTISGLLAIYAAASGILSPIAGLLADKYASRRQLPFVCGLVFLLLATILLALGQSVAVLAIARFLQGASGGVVWTIGMAIIVETVGQENLGKTMGTMFSFISVAGLFSPTMGGLLYAKSGYNGVFGLGIGLVVVDLILRLLMIEKKTAAGFNPPLSETSDEDSNPVRGQTETSPLLPKDSSCPDRYRLLPPSNGVTRSVPILLLLRDPGLLTAIWMGFMQSMLLGALDATVPLVASEQFGFNSLKAGLLFLPLGISDLCLGPVFGWGIDRYGTRLFAVIGFTWLIPMLVLLRLPAEPWITSRLANGHVVALYSCLLALNGVGMAIINSPAIVEAGQIVEQYAQANQGLFEQTPWAQLYGINSMVFSGGLTVGPLIAGALRESIGYGNMNALLACMCGLTAGLSAKFVGRRKDGFGPRDGQVE